MITVAVPRETTPGRDPGRADSPGARPLIKGGLAVRIQAGAGEAAGFPGRRIPRAARPSPRPPLRPFSGADVVLKVREPRAIEGGGHEADLLAKARS